MLLFIMQMSVYAYFCDFLSVHHGGGDEPLVRRQEEAQLGHGLGITQHPGFIV